MKREELEAQCLEEARQALPAVDRCLVRHGGVTLSALLRDENIPYGIGRRVLDMSLGIGHIKRNQHGMGYVAGGAK